mgnify:CR=1 FL=1
MGGETYVRRYLERAGQRAERKGLEFSYDLPTNIASAYTDPHRLGKILDCLLENAIKLTAARSMRVNVESANDQLTVAVSDTGPGLSPDRLQAIFAARDDLSWTGTALRCAENVGSFLTAESTEGQDRTFTLTIPLEYKGGPPPGRGVTPSFFLLPSIS